MTRKSYIWDKKQQKLVEVNREEVATAPFFESDQLEKPLKHVVSGKWFDSKSEYRKETKRLGFVEVGNDLNDHIENPRKFIGLDRGKIEEAFYKAKNFLNYKN